MESWESEMVDYLYYAASLPVRDELEEIESLDIVELFDEFCRDD